MSDSTSNHEPEDVVHDADGDAVNVEAVNDGVPAPAQGAGTPAADADGTPAAETAPGAKAPGAGSDAHPDTALAAERLGDLQRLQAEYVNYKRRVDRDRADIQIRAAHDVLETLLPVLDEIHLARQHGDLDEGPFRAIADKLEQALGRYGLVQVGAKGEPFDPAVHEALMHAAWDSSDSELPSDATTTTVVTVLQPGYKAGERVLRAARVAVADPE